MSDALHRSEGDDVPEMDAHTFAQEVRKSLLHDREFCQTLVQADLDGVRAEVHSGYLHVFALGADGENLSLYTTTTEIRRDVSQVCEKTKASLLHILRFGPRHRFETLLSLIDEDYARLDPEHPTIAIPQTHAPLKAKDWPTDDDIVLQTLRENGLEPADVRLESELFLLWQAVLTQHQGNVQEALRDWQGQMGFDMQRKLACKIDSDPLLAWWIRETGNGGSARIHLLLKRAHADPNLTVREDRELLGRTSLYDLLRQRWPEELCRRVRVEQSVSTDMELIHLKNDWGETRDLIAACACNGTVDSEETDNTELLETLADLLRSHARLAIRLIPAVDYNEEAADWWKTEAAEESAEQIPTSWNVHVFVPKKEDKNLSKQLQQYPRSYELLAHTEVLEQRICNEPELCDTEIVGGDAEIPCGKHVSTISIGIEENGSLREADIAKLIRTLQTFHTQNNKLCIHLQLGDEEDYATRNPYGAHIYMQDL